MIQNAKTLVWNGPLGVFEWPAFAEGTQALADAIARSQAFTLAGGGDTLSAIDVCGVAAHIDYQSTGGGAFLAVLEGHTLPAVATLTWMWDIKKHFLKCFLVWRLKWVGCAQAENITFKWRLPAIRCDVSLSFLLAFAVSETKFLEWYWVNRSAMVFSNIIAAVPCAMMCIHFALGYAQHNP